jgi:hypothetical protein
MSIEAMKLAKAWFERNTYGDEAVEEYEALVQAIADAEQPAQHDIHDLIAGALGVSRGTAYDLMREALTEQVQQVAEPYGQVTVVRRPGCVDQHWFYRWPEPPYLDNAAECHTVYTAPPPRQPLTDEMVVAAARMLSDRQAAACNVDCGDMWKMHGNDFIEDARAALEAAHGIKGEA